LLEGLVFPEEPTKLLSFFGGQTFPFALIDLVLLDPSPQRLGGHSEFFSDPRD